MTLNQIKLLAAVISLVVLILGSYYKGVSDTADKYEKKILAAQVELANKISIVEHKSNEIANNIKIQTEEANSKLDSLLKKKRGPLTTTPCAPTLDFSTTWNEINKETK